MFRPYITWFNYFFEPALESYQNIIRLDVSMEDVASFEQLESQEELLAVGTHGLNVEPNVFTIFLQHLSQIHTMDAKYN